MFFQIEMDLLNPLVSTFILILLMAIMIIVYLKIRIWLLVAILFFSSLIIGFMALNVENPFTPYFQMLFLLFQTIIFILTSLQAWRKQ